MTLQSSFDLDIFVKITTSSSQTIISAKGLEEVFSLIQYSILALIASFLTATGNGLDRVINQLILFTAWLKMAFLTVVEGEIDREITIWLKVVFYFSFSFGKGLCRELVILAT